jgi:hypothetical protein
MRAILHQHEDDFVQVNEGLIDASKLARQRRAVAEALAEPAARDWWTENAHLFSQGFQDYVASALAT